MIKYDPNAVNIRARVGFAFATGYRSTRAVVIGFSCTGQELPALQVGDVRVRYLAWDASEGTTPEHAAESFHVVPAGLAAVEFPTVAPDEKERHFGGVLEDELLGQRQRATEVTAPSPKTQITGKPKVVRRRNHAAVDQPPVLHRL